MTLSNTESFFISTEERLVRPKKTPRVKVRDNTSSVEVNSSEIYIPPLLLGEGWGEVSGHSSLLLTNVL